MHNLFDNKLSSNSDRKNEIHTSILKLRGKTLIFGNTVYQISNISALELLDISTEKPIPSYFWWLFFIGLSLLFFPGNIKIIGIVTFLVLAWLFHEWQKTKLKKRYGLRIRMNAGFSEIILSSDSTFLKRIIIVLNNIINSDQVTAFTFNLDQNQIFEDNSMNIENMNNSNIIAGDVTGDVVNNT